MNIVFGLVSILISIGVPVALVVLIVRAARRDGPDDVSSVFSLRRLLQYGFLLGSLVTAAIGLTLLLELALESGERLVGGGADTAALGLSLTIVAVPVWVIVWRLVSRHLRQDPDERASAAWSLYLGAAASIALLVAFVYAVQVGMWALGTEDFRAQPVAGAVVWGAVWVSHVWLSRRPWIAPAHRLAPAAGLVGSAFGIVALGLGLGGLLYYGFSQVYRAAAAGGALVEGHSGDVWRRSLAIAVLAAFVWWWHWLRQARHASRDVAWHAYVMLVGILAGLLTAVGSAAVALNAVLVWLFGQPDASSAAVHFDLLPPAGAALLIGAWAWLYHRAVLVEAPDRQRTEPERAYGYLVSAVALGSAAAGIVVSIMAAIQVLAPAPFASPDLRGRNTLIVAVTLLVVGVPLWGAFWRRLQSHARHDAEAECDSPSRRAYLFLLFGATGLAAVVSLVIMLFVFLRDLLEGTLHATIVYELRPAIALVVTAGGLSAYHWTVYRADRAARPARPERLSRSVLLVSSDGRSLAQKVAELTGASVRSFHRLDAGDQPVDADAVAEAILGSPHERILVEVEHDGVIRVIPYEPA